MRLQTCRNCDVPPGAFDVFDLSLDGSAPVVIMRDENGDEWGDEYGELADDDDDDDDDDDEGRT